MWDDEDQLPRVKTNISPIRRDLSPLSIAELQEYRQELEAEIARIDEESARKTAHQQSASALFKTG